MKKYDRSSAKKSVEKYPVTTGTKKRKHCGNGYEY